jgi:hypothetical protein
MRKINQPQSRFTVNQIVDKTANLRILKVAQETTNHLFRFWANEEANR